MYKYNVHTTPNLLMICVTNVRLTEKKNSAIIEPQETSDHVDMQNCLKATLLLYNMLPSVSLTKKITKCDRLHFNSTNI